MVGLPHPLHRGRGVWNIQYADDTILLARNKDGCMAETLGEESLELGSKINNHKTNVRMVHREGQFSTQGETTAKVDKF